MKMVWVEARQNALLAEDASLHGQPAQSSVCLLSSYGIEQSGRSFDRSTAVLEDGAYSV